MLRFYAIQVPVPPNTARCYIHVGMGRAKYEPEQRAIVWRIKRMIGGSEAVFAAEVELTPSIREKAWSRPPIQVALNLQYHSVDVFLCSNGSVVALSVSIWWSHLGIRQNPSTPLCFHFFSCFRMLQADFQVPMFTSSGVQVRFLKVYDKSGYLTKRWVRYITRAGHYQIRI